METIINKENELIIFINKYYLETSESDSYLTIYKKLEKAKYDIITDVITSIGTIKQSILKNKKIKKIF